MELLEGVMMLHKLHAELISLKRQHLFTAGEVWMFTPQGLNPLRLQSRNKRSLDFSEQQKQGQPWIIKSCPAVVFNRICRRRYGSPVARHKEPQSV